MNIRNIYAIHIFIYVVVSMYILQGYVATYVRTCTIDNTHLIWIKNAPTYVRTYVRINCSTILITLCPKQ